MVSYMEEVNESGKKEVDKWLKRHEKKTFYLFKKAGEIYHLIWKDAGKVKAGTVRDGMWTRYGLSTYAVIKGLTVFDIWTDGSDMDIGLYDEMTKVYNENSGLPVFKLTQLKNLRN